MTANINPKTLIPYGVVSINSLAEWVWDEFFNNGVNESAKYRHDEFKREWASENPSLDESSSEYQDAEQRFFDSDECDEDEYSLETKDGLKLGMSTLGGAYNVWVFESPVVVKCCRCSPCCPNAGDLDNPGDHLAYSLPDEWFENGVNPRKHD